MKQLTLRRTDLTVSEICLGGDHFGTRLDRETVFSLLDRFRDAGGSFVDTAHVYARADTYSRSERLLGDYLRARGRRALVVATKGAHPDLRSMRTPRLNAPDVAADLDESLRELGLDEIALYWLHRDDPSLPAGEIVSIMDSFVRAGKIRFWGISNYTAARAAALDDAARAHGLAGPCAVSDLWSPAHPNKPLYADDTLVTLTDDELPALDARHLAVIPYSATARGWFAKRAAGADTARLDAVFENPYNEALLARLSRSGRPVQTALLEEIRALPGQIVPITSVSAPAQLDDVLAVHAE